MRAPIVVVMLLVMLVAAPAAADSFVPLLRPEFVPLDPPHPIAHEATRVGAAVALINAGVVRWQVMAYWRSAHRPWRALLREWTSDGHCDAVLTIRRERILDHRRSSATYGRWSVGRRFTTQRVQTVYCGA